MCQCECACAPRDNTHSSGYKKSQIIQEFRCYRTTRTDHRLCEGTVQPHGVTTHWYIVYFNNFYMNFYCALISRQTDPVVLHWPWPKLGVDYPPVIRECEIHSWPLINSLVSRWTDCPCHSDYDIFFDVVIYSFVNQVQCDEDKSWLILTLYVLNFSEWT